LAVGEARLDLGFYYRRACLGDVCTQFLIKMFISHERDKLLFCF
jgi:hypothetical protein